MNFIPFRFQRITRRREGGAGGHACGVIEEADPAKSGTNKVSQRKRIGISYSKGLFRLKSGVNSRSLTSCTKRFSKPKCKA